VSKVQYPIIGMVVDKQGRTIVAAQNGIYELRSSFKGDELVALTPDDEPSLRETVEREQAIAAETRRIVEDSRQKEASNGNDQAVKLEEDPQNAGEEVGKAIEPETDASLLDADAETKPAPSSH
jgi:hypothetical protein